MNYLIAIGVLVFLTGLWALFQLWIGHQADGTPVDSDARDCHGCGHDHGEPPEPANKEFGVRM